MNEFFHMSPRKYAVGDLLNGDGLDKVDSLIECALDAVKPTAALSRRDAMFCRDVADFSRCGIVNAGYIYRVRPKEPTSRYDLSWIGEMQKARLKEKYHCEQSNRFSQYPDWTENLVSECCNGYWSGTALGDPVWEYLAPALLISRIVTDFVVGASDTRGGWKG